MIKINNLCVLGAGTMGRQIALNAAYSGINTVLYNRKGTLEKAETANLNYMERGLSKGRYTKDELERTFNNLVYTDDFESAIKNADLVIESVAEKKDIKIDFFIKINKYAPKHCIISSNSSYMPSSMFKEYIVNPNRLANLHYFNPPMRMELVEIVRGEHTSQETIEILKNFVDSIGKTYITVNKEIEGFVVNRLLRAVQDEAYYLLENGVASFDDIDTGAEKGLNYPMGPFRLLDLTGLDINYYNRQRKYEETGNPEDAPPKSLEEKFKKGEFGKKTGKGWYDYSEK